MMNYIRRKEFLGEIEDIQDVQDLITNEVQKIRTDVGMGAISKEEAEIRVANLEYMVFGIEIANKYGMVK